MSTFSKKVKIFLILTLCIIVAGMAVLGFLDFNKATEQVNNYEVTVGVDQNIDNEAQTVREVAEKYFESVGAKRFNVRELDDGNYYVYTFTENVIDIKVLDESVKQAIAGSTVVASAELVEVRAISSDYILDIVLALSVAGALILIYLLILDKAAVAFTTLINGILSVVLFVAMAALIRVPVYSNLSIFVAMSFLVSLIVSIVLSHRFKEITKLVGNEKMDYKDVVAKGIKDSKFRLILLSILLLLSAAILSIAFTAYLVYATIYMLIASAIAIYSAILGSSIFWPLFKSIKKKA